MFLWLELIWIWLFVIWSVFKIGLFVENLLIWGYMLEWEIMEVFCPHDDYDENFEWWDLDFDSVMKLYSWFL